MSNSIPGEFSNTRDDGEFEPSGGSGTIGPDESDLSLLSDGEDQNPDEVDNMKGNDRALESANALVSKIDRHFNLGRVLLKLGGGGSSAAAATRASTPPQKPEASGPSKKGRGGRGARKGPAMKRKRRRQEDPATFVALAFRELKKDDYCWPRPTRDHKPRKCRK